jgi:endonuclease/exonuclease/phosphatase (EEP) superfamily protein YafD
MLRSVEHDAPGDVGGNSAAAGPQRHWDSIGLALVQLGWGVVAVLATLAFLRIVAWDSLEPLIVFNSLSAVAYLPAWLVAAGAALGRRWWLLGAAGLVIVAQLAFVAPELLAASPVPQWAHHAPTVRLFDANVDKNPIFASEYKHAIESFQPDVLSFEEFTPQSFDSLATSGILRSYPFQCSAPQPGAIGFFVASRWRLSGCRILLVHRSYVGYFPTPYMVEATLATPGGPVALRVVHTLAPFPMASNEWRAALAAVNSSIRSTGTSRMLMVGDFNATWGNRAFVTLLGDGLTDGAAARGQALAMTWPNGAIVPPFVRIDHVLTGGSLTVVHIATGAGIGSDHHYLTAAVAVRQ